jgi:hypothetical protein
VVTASSSKLSVVSFLRIIFEVKVMNKQKLTVSFGLIAVLLSNLIATPVFAGQGPSPGVAPGGSSFFVITPVGAIIFSPVVQGAVNSIAVTIISRPAAINSPLSVVTLILRGGPGASTSAARIQTALVNVRVSPVLAQALIRSLGGIFRSRVGATSGVPVAQLEASQLVAKNKGLSALKVAQSEETPDVDINQLNDSINAYNQIILESSPETLRELAKNEEFVAIGNVLRELGQALKK